MDVDAQRDRNAQTEQQPSRVPSGVATLGLRGGLEAAGQELALLLLLLRRSGHKCSLRWSEPDMGSPYRVLVTVVRLPSASSRKTDPSSAIAQTLESWLRRSLHCTLIARR